MSLYNLNTREIYMAIQRPIELLERDLFNYDPPFNKEKETIPKEDGLFMVDLKRQIAGI